MPAPLAPTSAITPSRLATAAEWMQTPRFTEPIARRFTRWITSATASARSPHWLARSGADPTTHPRRVMTLAEVANVAVFMASDKASGMTGSTINLTMGSLDD